ncbi:hypothetical protein BDR05DRAFT_955088, partial [Suillus weaverae]
MIWAAFEKGVPTCHPRFHLSRADDQNAAIARPCAAEGIPYLPTIRSRPPVPYYNFQGVLFINSSSHHDLTDEGTRGLRFLRDARSDKSSRLRGEIRKYI